MKMQLKEKTIKNDSTKGIMSFVHKKNNDTKRMFLLSLLSLLMVSITFGQIKLPALVSDSMVLQRDKPVTIWGWSLGGDEVTVTFNGKKFKAKPAENNRWQLQLPATKAGGPYDLTISTGNSSITVKEILFGDVWLCSGQSNMGFQMQDLAANYPKDLVSSENNLIREFAVGRQISFTPKETTKGQWKRACPANIGNFSAVAYYMAKNLYDKYKVPIGIIHSSWGGTPAQAWVSEEGLKGFNNYLEKLPSLKDSIWTDSIAKRDKSVTSNWYKEIKEKDKGLNKNDKPWYSEDVNTVDWKTMKVPGNWENYGAKNVNGVVWARKEITLTKEMIAHDALLNLGRIDDIDTTYFNGVKVGFTPMKYTFRRYKVPASLLKEGTNVITVRIITPSGAGGFIPEKNYNLTLDNQVIDLTGNWNYQVGVAVPAIASNTFTSFQGQPTGLYNGMIAPLISYTIKGAAWYQGEANAHAHKEYRMLLPSLIADWRKHFAQGDFPFLIVQLANYMATQKEPSESNWAGLRDAQLNTSQQVANCGLAVTIDIGDTYNIHPQNKGEVGKRLALAAEKVAYNEEGVVYSGPVYKSMQVNGNKIILTFNSIGSGLFANGGGELKQFTIAGEDKKFVWAKAYIKDNQVVVESDEVANPIAVRYAWADNPVGSNLYNIEGLPASPFRTDDWDTKNSR